MNTQAFGLYNWKKPNAWKIDFIDKAAGGIDNLYIDAVDTSAIIAHGNGNGFTMEGSNPAVHGLVSYTDAASGNAWGNSDLEFHAWLSCQVLEEDWGGLKWYERWGPTFNGLHLICGFQTNAYVGGHRMLQYFAENQYDNEQTVRKSWFNAADDDQPDNVEAVVMGVLISSSLGSYEDYNSIESSIPGYRRSSWNDHIWGVDGGPSQDVRRGDIAGYWRVVYTVVA